MMRIIIPDERPPSWNQYYAGAHWSKRRSEAERTHALVRAHIPDGPMIEMPVAIRVDVFFRGRPLDADNIPAKLYVDGLCDYIFPNDSPRYVSEVTTASHVDKTNPRVEITLTPAAQSAILDVSSSFERCASKVSARQS